MSELDAAVELLERSLGYTRVALADIGSEHLRRPTPCAGWDLARLLLHLEDGLDAFTEAASGLVRVDPPPPPDLVSGRVGRLRDKACALLGAWSAHRPVDPLDPVRVGELVLAGPVLVATAAVEITVHGWDVAQTTGTRRPIPADLADALHGVAEMVLLPQDRQGRFAPEVAVHADRAPDTALLGYLGRSARSPFGGDFAGGGVSRVEAS